MMRPMRLRDAMKMTTGCIAAALIVPASSLAAARPSLSAPGVPVGKIVGAASPYVETSTTVDLAVTYAGSLAHGSKLQLLVRAPGSTIYKATKIKIVLRGGRAKVPVTEHGIGGPYKYEVAVVAGSRRLALSKPFNLYWAQPPGGLFVLTTGESAYTSLTRSTESCEVVGKCKGDIAPGSSLLRAAAGNTPMPATWTVTLIYNGAQLCTTKDIGGECNATVTFPEVSAATQIPITAELTSPTGKITSATLLVTEFP
jgi:hypothetical protein